MLMVKAHAKINVALSVNEKKENGYHEVDMVMVPLELHDRVEIEILPDGYDTYITTDDICIPTDESNLAIKAFMVLKKHFNFKQSFRIHIHKIIPVQAGLGGGSSDAAVVIKTVIKLLKLKVEQEELIKIAKEVGSDVPFFLFNKPARARGEGEQLEFIPIKKTYSCLLIKPKVGVSTALCYKEYDLDPSTNHPNIEKIIEGFKNDDLNLLKEEMKNDLEKPAFKLAPEIQEVKNKLITEGLDMVLMSGSGAAVFALSTNVKKLQSVSKKFNPKEYFVRVTEIIK